MAIRNGDKWRSESSRNREAQRHLLNGYDGDIRETSAAS